MKIGDLVTWVQRNGRQIGIVIAFHSADPDMYRFGHVFCNEEAMTTLMKEADMKVLS